jgi:hypothetical protein
MQAYVPIWSIWRMAPPSGFVTDDHDMFAKGDSVVLFGPAGRIASRFADHLSPLVPWVQGVTGGGPLKRSEAWVLDICYEA